HTARDQAETVLLRILRGTGVGGLAAMAAGRDGYVRPLLALPREVIAGYARSRGLVPWDDPMNDQERFARVRVRRDLMPQLRRENPAIEAALCRLAAHAAEWSSALDVLAEPLSLRLCASALAPQPAAVRKRALALALARRGVGFDASHLEQLDELLCRPAQGSVAVDLPGAQAVREYDQLVLLVRQPGAPVDAGSPGPAAPPPGEVTSSVTSSVPPTLRDPSLYLARNLLPGDRMQPARLGGRSKKLAAMFVDRKIPRRLRASALVVCRRSDGAIVWAEHLGWAHGEEPRGEQAR
ncbi:MAG TPA: ATP-binding protein, partial [Kofleriaceae bacterium]|nr:ATP-binding protein [Kofleriaceae bacterium]